MPLELDNDRLLTRSEVAAKFGLSQRFLEVSAFKGGGPPMVKIGRSVRYRVIDIRSWMRSASCRHVLQGYCLMSGTRSARRGFNKFEQTAASAVRGLGKVLGARSGD